MNTATTGSRWSLEERAASVRRSRVDSSTRAIPSSSTTATSAGPAEALAAEINAAGGRAISIGADVADSNSVTAMFEQATEELGPPTIVVNNAGVSEPASALKMEPASWDRMIAVNLSGAFYCTHAALPAMYELGWGRVVFLGSPGGGRTISAGMTAYAAAKAGIVAMTTGSRGRGRPAGDHGQHGHSRVRADGHDAQFR